MDTTSLIVRRLPAARHSFSSYFVIIDGVARAELPPLAEPNEVKVELDPGKHTLEITVKSLGVDVSMSKGFEIIAEGRTLKIEVTPFLRGLMFWAEPIVALLPWLWFRGEVRITKVNDK